MKSNIDILIYLLESFDALFMPEAVSCGEPNGPITLQETNIKRTMDAERMNVGRTSRKLMGRFVFTPEISQVFLFFLFEPI